MKKYLFLLGLLTLALIAISETAHRFSSDRAHEDIPTYVLSAPDSPSYPVAHQLSSDKIALSWQNAEDVNFYVILTSDSLPFWHKVAVVSGVDSFVVLETNAQESLYKILACNLSGCSRELDSPIITP